MPTLYIAINADRAKTGAADVKAALAGIRADAHLTEQALQGKGGGPARAMTNFSRETRNASAAMQQANRQLEIMEALSKRNHLEAKGFTGALMKMGEMGELMMSFGDAMAGIGTAAKSAAGIIGDDLAKEIDNISQGAMGLARVGALFGPWATIIMGAIGGVAAYLGNVADAEAKVAEEAKKVEEAERKAAEQAEAFAHKLELMKKKDLGDLTSRIRAVSDEMENIAEKASAADTSVSGMVESILALKQIKEGDLQGATDLLYAGSLDILQKANEARYGKRKLDPKDELAEAEKELKAAEAAATAFYEKQQARKDGMEAFGQTSLTKEKLELESAELREIRSQMDAAAARYEKAKKALEPKKGGKKEKEEESQRGRELEIPGIEKTLADADREIEKRNELLGVKRDSVEFYEIEAKAALYEQAIREKGEDLNKREMKQLDERARKIAKAKKAEDDLREAERKRNAVRESFAGASREIDKTRALVEINATSREQYEIEAAVLERVYALKAQGVNVTEAMTRAIRDQVSTQFELNEALEAQEAARRFQEEAFAPIKSFAEQNPIAEFAELGISALDDLAGAFADFLTTGEADFKAFAQSLKRELIELLIKQAMVAGLNALIGLATGGASTGILTAAKAVGSVLHSGGIVGQGGTPRSAPAALWAKAPRYHSGGVIGGDERAAILQVGEEVLTKSDPRHRRNGGGRSVVNNIDARTFVNATDPSSFARSERNMSRLQERRFNRALLEN